MSEGVSVVHVMVAAPLVMPPAAMPEMTGGAGVAVVKVKSPETARLPELSALLTR